jgi:hypothetical protein
MKNEEDAPRNRNSVVAEKFIKKPGGDQHGQFSAQQQLGVFLCRIRVAAGLLLLVFACGASARLLQINTVPKAASAVPDDITLVDSNYAKLRPNLPQGQVVCFVAEPGIPREKALGERWSAQYSLAPNLLIPGEDCEFVIQRTSLGACVSTRSRQTCETFRTEKQ